MSKQIDRLIAEIVQDNMLVINKMKKADLVQLTKELMVENFRELHTDSIVEIYEERFGTNLVKV